MKTTTTVMMMTIAERRKTTRMMMMTTTSVVLFYVLYFCLSSSFRFEVVVKSSVEDNFETVVDSSNQIRRHTGLLLKEVEVSQTYSVDSEEIDLVDFKIDSVDLGNDSVDLRVGSVDSRIDLVDSKADSVPAGILANVGVSRMSRSGSNSDAEISRGGGKYWGETGSDATRFRFVIDTSGGCDPLTFVLVIVCSASQNEARRVTIRKTWASLDDRGLRVLFLVGLPPPPPPSANGNRSSSDVLLLQGAIERESQRHGDLLQADFVDVYANLSLKSIAMLQWTATNCRRARFLVKADDDIFVNTPLLVRDLGVTVHRNFVMGNVIAGAHPIRDAASKWYTPVASYDGNVYPKYVSGAAYVISGDAVTVLYAAALRTRVFWVEDVFITGLLPTATRRGSDVTSDVQHIYNGKFDISRKLNDPCALKRHIIRHLSETDDMKEMWDIVTSKSICQS